MFLAIFSRIFCVASFFCINSLSFEPPQPQQPADPAVAGMSEGKGSPVHLLYINKICLKSNEVNFYTSFSILVCPKRLTDRQRPQTKKSSTKQHSKHRTPNSPQIDLDGGDGHEVAALVAGEGDIPSLTKRSQSHKKFTGEGKKLWKMTIQDEYLVWLTCFLLFKKSWSTFQTHPMDFFFKPCQPTRLRLLWVSTLPPVCALPMSMALGHLRALVGRWEARFMLGRKIKSLKILYGLNSAWENSIYFYDVFTVIISLKYGSSDD